MSKHNGKRELALYDCGQLGFGPTRRSGVCMMKRQAFLVGVILLFCLGVNFAFAQGYQSSPEAVRSATVLTIHAKIAGVDKAAKQVTLEGPTGRKVTIVVQNPVNLKAAAVGDPVVVRYYEVVTVRKKNPGEMVPSASVKQGIATARPGGVPGGIAEEKVSLLVSVAAIDKADGTVTIKAPDGSIETVRARDPKNLDRIKVGDDLVVTLSRATAIAIAKEPAS
jgi:hypothetical protein